MQVVVLRKLMVVLALVIGVTLDTNIQSKHFHGATLKNRVGLQKQIRL
jgi:hypothetical protein